MLVQTDINELGDKRLDEKENVVKLREKCLAMTAQKRLYKQDELEDPNRAFGPRLQLGEFISKLRRIAPSLKFLDGSVGNIAVYFPRNRKEYEEAEEAWQMKQDHFFLHNKYVGGFAKKELQEYGTLDVDNAGLATKEHRAWRTVLIMLLQQGVVSYRAVVKEFGDVGSDRRGWRWLEQTRKWRNNPDAVFASN